MQCPPYWVSVGYNGRTASHRLRGPTTPGNEVLGLFNLPTSLRTVRGHGAGRGEYTSRCGSQMAGQCAKAYKLGWGPLASADKTEGDRRRSLCSPWPSLPSESRRFFARADESA